jgi:cytochrome c1
MCVRALCAAALASAAGCGFGTERGMSASDAAQLTGGSPTRGAAQIRRYGCGTCHVVPGVPGANSLVGPPLRGMGERAYVAGVVVNTPENLVRWIRDPQGVDSLTAMPSLGVTESDARDIAAYLYTVR